MTSFCCQMRAKFRVDVVEILPGPEPENLVDYLDWERVGVSGRPAIVPPFCCFCGSRVKDSGRVAQPKCWCLGKNEEGGAIWLCPEHNPFKGSQLE